MLYGNVGIVESTIPTFPQSRQEQGGAEERKHLQSNKEEAVKFVSKDFYVGMDVHAAMIVVVVLNTTGEVFMELVIPTQQEAVLTFLRGLRGRIHVTFEQGCQATWLYHVIRPLVAEVIVCNPRHNRLVLSGSKSDNIDARKLAELLRQGALRPVYQAGDLLRELKETVYNYDSIVQDSVRLMSRIRALYRSQGITCRGRGLYDAHSRSEWLDKIAIHALQTRIDTLCQQLDLLDPLRQQAASLLRQEIRRHPARKYLRCPGIKTIRAAQIIATVGTPHRFRTSRQYWSYSGLAVVTKSTSDFEIHQGRIRRRPGKPLTRGLNRNFSRRMKRVYKGAAQHASHHKLFQPYFEALLDRGLRKPLARLTLARKIAAINLATWKKEENFDPKKVHLK